MARSAEQLHRHAVDLVNRGRFSDARRMLHAADELTDDPDVRGRVAGTLAYLTARTGGLSEAMQICQAAIDSPGLGGHTRAILAGQMGALAEQAGQFDEAERWLATGIAGLESDPPALANLLVNRSLVNMRRGVLSAAAADAEAARSIFEEIGSPVDEAQARHNEGYIALLGGDLVAAMRMMSRARGELADISAVMAATCDVDRAEVLRDAGMTTEAEQILAKAATVFGAYRVPQARAEAELHLARSLLTHDPAGAGRSAAASARRFRVLGNDAWAARAEGIRLRAAMSGGAVRKGGGRVADPRRLPQAEDVDSAASALDEVGFRNEAAALRMTRTIWRARHGLPDAMASTRVPASASMEVQLLAREAQAARATTAGRHAAARRQAAAGLDVLSRWQDEFGSLDLQTSIAMHGNQLIFAGLGSAVRSGRPDVVFEWSERARHLSQQVVPLRPPPDPELAADLAELRMLRADDPDWLADPRAAGLRERARERQWSQTGRARLQQRVSLDELHSRLDDQTALIAYVYTGDALTALVVTDSTARLVSLEDAPRAWEALPGLRADLDMAASVRSGPMAAVVRQSLDARMETLSRALLDAPAKVAGTRRLVITTPGVLSGIPWAMLPGMSGRVFTLAASASRWVGSRDDFDATARGSGFAVGPRVARGDEEVSVASSAWAHTRTLRADTATVDAVTELASEVDVLHVAAHGRHAVDNPLFSGLELADGALFGYDIDRMPRVPATVVLSACEVGRSSVRWGEEAIGMTRIWLHAGVRSVIATPVIVADDVACELLGAMHEGLVTGLPPAEALAAAATATGLVAPFQTHGAGF